MTVALALSLPLCAASAVMSSFCSFLQLVDGDRKILVGCGEGVELAAAAAYCPDGVVLLGGCVGIDKLCSGAYRRAEALDALLLVELVELVLYLCEDLGTP